MKLQLFTSAHIGIEPCRITNLFGYKECPGNSLLYVDWCFRFCTIIQLGFLKTLLPKKLSPKQPIPILSVQQLLRFFFFFVSPRSFCFPIKDCQNCLETFKRIFENVPGEVCSHWSEKGPKGERFCVRKARNNTSKGKGEERQKE